MSETVYQKLVRPQRTRKRGKKPYIENRLQIRLTEDQFAIVDTLCAAHRMNRSQYMRWLLQKAADKELSFLSSLQDDSSA